MKPRIRGSVRHGLATLVTTLLLSHSGWALAQQPYLVKDISNVVVPTGSNPQNLLTLGDTTYLAATTPEHGSELWKTDGTAAGTALVKDLRSGVIGSNPHGLIAVGTTLYFSADERGRNRLWRSDGTDAGTMAISPEELAAGVPVVAGETLFFAATDPDHGTELWKSDGTAAGTSLVKDIVPGPTGSQPEMLTAVGTTMYFRAFGEGGQELWKSDGTDAGTVRVKDLAPGPAFASIYGLVAMGHTLFFVADDGNSGFELWKSDGTEAGTVMVKDIWPGSGSGVQGAPTVVGNLLYFAANDGGLFSNGNEPWKSDGTEAGTVQLAEISPPFFFEFPPLFSPIDSNPTQFTAVGNTVYFAARGRNANADVGIELWKTDGTSAGTVLVKDIAPFSASSNPQGLRNINGTLYFAATVPVRFGIPSFPPEPGTELWKTDGTNAGTVLVRDIFPGSSSSDPAFISPLGSGFLFRANDGTNGAELWRSDGTEAGTVLVKNIAPNITPDSSNEGPQSLTALGDKLLFSAADAVAGVELWGSDGTEAGTAIVKDVPGTSALAIGEQQFVAIGDVAYYWARDPANGIELWRSDGTDAGTSMVKDIFPGTGSSMFSNTTPMRAVGTTIYFTADDGVHGAEPWKSDGTAAGTVIVKDVRPGIAGSAAGGFAVIGGALYFGADDGVHGRELWRTDGTEAGTVMVADSVPGAASGSPTPPVVLNGALYFTVDDVAHGRELWRSDGTANGTFMLIDLNPGPADGSFTDYFVFGNAVYFRGSDGATGAELWRTDGTVSGTTLVRDIFPGPAGGLACPLPETPSAGSKFYFAALDDPVSRTLWMSDGTATGTRSLGVGLANDCAGLAFRAIGGSLYFQGIDTAGGEELWRTDGTEAGTERVADIVPGSGGSVPRRLTPVRSRLYFTAYVPDAGRELFALDLPNLAPIANAGPSRTVRLGSLVTLDGSASIDPDLGPAAMAYAWSQSEGPIVDLTGAENVRPTFTPTLAGVFGFGLVVSDGADSSAPATVLLTVPPLGDVDLDGDVDLADLNLLLAARNTAANGLNDLRDLNGDTRIDALDARKLTLLCTRPRCAAN